jgi:GNAT superfamily N-acetyltransferase
MEDAREALLQRYLAFSCDDWSLVERDIAAELGLPAAKPVPGQIGLWILKGGECVGELARMLVLRGSDLIIGHRQFKIRLEELRRQGFGSALSSAADAWYREVGVSAISQSAEGDGSLFAARRGYDFDVDSYRNRGGLEEASAERVRAAAVAIMMGRPGIYETVPGDQAPRRESVQQLLNRLSAAGGLASTAVTVFQARLPQPDAMIPADALLSPSAIATFGEPLEELDGATLGREVLRRTAWRGIKWL